jgi:hypothetical protein
MPTIQSADDDRYSVHFGSHVSIYELSRAEAEAIVASYTRKFRMAVEVERDRISPSLTKTSRSA